MAEEDQFQDMPFPIYGLDVSVAYSRQPPQTTPVGINVRAYEPKTRRARGGSRPGLSKFIVAQVSGTNKIQCIDTVVWTSQDALLDPVILQDAVGFASGGQADPSNLGRGGGFVRVGGTGARTKPKKLVIKLTCPTTTLPSDGTTATITATVTKGGIPQSSKTVLLITSPAGKNGDQATGQTSFFDGTVKFTVSDNATETVSYRAVVLGPASFGVNSIAAQSNIISITYAPLGTVTYTYSGTVQNFDNGTVCNVLANYLGSDSSSGFAVPAPPHLALLDSNPPFTLNNLPNIGQNYPLYDNRSPPDPTTITANLRFQP